MIYTGPDNAHPCNGCYQFARMDEEVEIGASESYWHVTCAARVAHELGIDTPEAEQALAELPALADRLQEP